MAGMGRRFKDAGYHEEKYAIEFGGHTLLDWSLASLTGFREFQLILITRPLPGIEEILVRSANALGFSDPIIITLDGPTRGQAETAALATPVVDPEDSILIFNTDTFVDPAFLNASHMRGKGWIPTFSATGDKWSFVEADGQGRAIRTTEKVRISDHCSVGMYYFSSFGGYCELVDGAEEDGELYVAPLYNEWISRGHDTFIHSLPDTAVTVLGTPEDLQRAAMSNRPRWPDNC